MATIDNGNVNMEINNSMQKGYEKALENNEVGACELWIETWESVLTLLENQDYNSIEQLDRHLHLEQSIYNWASDFEGSLLNAGMEDEKYIHMRLKFCDEYIFNIEDKANLNTLNKKRSKADCMFALGRINEGDDMFQKLVDSNPHYGWGWIGWSDQYWVFSKPGIADSDKAIQILEDALKVPDLDNRWEVVDRLKTIYKDFDMYQEYDALKYPEQSQPHNKFDEDMLEVAKTMKQTFDLLYQQPIVKGEKIGRNDPCPCGSGKKYKKCCYNNE